MLRLSDNSGIVCGRLQERLAEINRELFLRLECESDVDFLRALYAATRAEEVALLGWDPVQRKTFLDQQFFAQRCHYRKHYPNAQFLVVIRQAEAIGRVYVDLGSSELRLMDIALLPAMRRTGLGTALISAVTGLAMDAGVDLTLHVEPFNPAMAWYQHLGFDLIEQVGVYWFMRLPEDRIRQAQAKLIS